MLDRTIIFVLCNPRCDQQHEWRRLARQHLLTIGQLHYFFAVLVCQLFSGGVAERTRSHELGDKPKNGTASNRNDLPKIGFTLA
jgi:hypothetical protein